MAKWYLQAADMPRPSLRGGMELFYYLSPPGDNPERLAGSWGVWDTEQDTFWVFLATSP